MSAPVLVFALICVFGAALIRGYSGFGFSALAVISLSLILPPAGVVPAVLMLEIAASLQLLPRLHRSVDWPAIGWLTAGSLIAMPFGVAMLATLPVAPMRALISVLVLIICVPLWKGFAFKFSPGKGATFTTGLISGVGNGAASLGGMPVVLFFLARGTVADVSRATVIAYFIVANTAAAGVAGYHGLLTTDLWVRFAIFLPALLAGNALGNLHFLKTSPESFRKFALILLVGMSVSGLVRALF
ncbi:MAG: sulfite exporter TauE/SafE family protein [Rhodospirillales bacterium]|nr:sulfite exporter TauE/SafE family protein [Rhodospirillales bacterium]